MSDTILPPQPGDRVRYHGSQSAEHGLGTLTEWAYPPPDPGRYAIALDSGPLLYNVRRTSFTVVIQAGAH